MKKNQPARAKKIDAEAPLSASSLSLGGPTAKASKLPTASQDDAKLALGKLQNELRTTGAAPDATVKRALANIKAKFGDEAGQEAIRKVNAAYRAYRPDLYPRNKAT